MVDISIFLYLYKPGGGMQSLVVTRCSLGRLTAGTGAGTQYWRLVAPPSPAQVASTPAPGGHTALR